MVAPSAASKEGQSISTISAPASVSRSRFAWNVSFTPGPYPGPASCLMIPTFVPCRSRWAPARAASAFEGCSSGREVESRTSWPPMTSCKSAASSTVRAAGPTWSRLEASAMSPYRETPPYVGLTPTVPVSAAGSRIEPPVSEPSASGAENAASVAEDPPPDPPGVRSRSHGFRVGRTRRTPLRIPSRIRRGSFCENREPGRAQALTTVAS